MRSNIPLISGSLKDSVYDHAGITDPVKLSSRFNNETEKDTWDIPLLGMILERVYTLSNLMLFFTVSVSSVSMVMFGKFVRSFGERDMNRYINSLSL